MDTFILENIIECDHFNLSFNNCKKMHFSVNRTEHIRRKPRSEKAIQASRGKNGFPKKSTIRRTMTVGFGQEEKQIKADLDFKIHTSAKPITNYSQMNPDKVSSMARLLESFPRTTAASGESEVCPHYQSAVSPRHNHYCSSRHHWSFGMGLALFVIIFTSTSSVSCVPIGGQGDGGGKLPSGSTRIPNVRYWGGREKVEPGQHYSVMSKGQIYLPSLMNNAPASSDYADGKENDEEQQQNMNYHIQRVQQQNREGNGFKHSAPIQKLISEPQRSGTNEEFEEDPQAPTGNDEDENTGQSDWETVLDPHLYVLTEWASPPYQEQFPLLRQQRKRRNSGTGPSLSIVNPLDVLRQRLLLEIARRRMRQSHNQIIANEEILRKIGRRR